MEAPLPRHRIVEAQAQGLDAARRAIDVQLDQVGATVPHLPDGGGPVVLDPVDLFSPTLYQLALAEFLGAGHFARHLRRMRGVYQRRRDALLAGLARHCGDRLTVHNADAGLHVAVLLADGLDDQDVVRRMAGRGLTATALSTCYAGTAGRSGLLLGFGGSTERRLLDATRVLGEVLRDVGAVRAPASAR